MGSLADRVRASRVAAGITEPAELARRVGVRPAAAYQWESGATKALKAETAIAVADAVGVTVKWLVTGKGPREAVQPAPQPTPRDLDRQLLAEAVTIARRETARLPLTDRQFAAVVEMCYDALVADMEIDRQHDTVAGMLRAFELEDKPNV